MKQEEMTENYGPVTIGKSQEDDEYANQGRERYYNGNAAERPKRRPDFTRRTPNKHFRNDDGGFKRKRQFDSRKQFPHKKGKVNRF